jgi:uncharacterized protein (UPF0297 family)
MSNLDQTMKMTPAEVNQLEANAILVSVFNALKEKGYNPITQIVGYIMSGDPSYITGHNNARALIRKLERDELLEELVRYYVEKL